MDSLMDYLSPHAVVGLIVGFCLYFLAHILRTLATGNDDTNAQSPTQQRPDTRKKEGKANKNAAKKSGWNSNRAGDNNKSKAAYSPPWIVTALKGHTGPVLDIDFSSSGKYLASCGEEDADADADTSSNSSSSSDSSKESVQFSPEQSPRQTKGLSRRQRKNRLRRDDSSPEKKKVSSTSKKMNGEKVEMSSSTKKKIAGPISQFAKFKLDEAQFCVMLKRYVLTEHERNGNGYPVALRQGGGVDKVTVYYRIEQWSAKKTRAMKKLRYDVHAAEFVPTKFVRYYNSSDSESSSSSSSEDLYHHGRVMYEFNPWTQHYYLEPYKQYHLMPMIAPSPVSECSVERSCVRCGNGFFTTHSEYLTQEKCSYHWGKPQLQPGESQRYYSCCGRNSPEGCTSAPLHVWNGSVEGSNGPYSDYVQALSPAKTASVYALDCEMCYTVAGLEVTKVSVVSMTGRLVYNAFIKPSNDIVDYNTRFSGITEKDMLRPNVKHLKQVQSDLKKLITNKTILIGHGLDNDLRALKLHHTMCVDTAFVFPHYKGLPYKMSLRHLTAQYLKRQVQTSSGGHDSYEDASACMELMLWRVRKDNKM